MNYKVGQILYMTNSESLKIIPIQVVEEVIRTTLHGKEKTYMIQLPDKKRTIADINALKGDVYEDVDILKADMISKATDSIGNMILMATKLASSMFEIAKENNDSVNNQNENSVQVETNNDIIMVDLGGGVKAKASSNILKQVINKWKYYY